MARNESSKELVFRLSGEVDGEKRSFMLSAGEQTLGSSRSADISITVAGVSRLHARALVGGGAVTIVDAGSRNGTFVDGARLGEGASPVEVGQEIRLGPVLLALEIADAEEGELGLELDLPSLSRTRDGGAETAVWQGEESSVALDLIVTLVELLTLPQPELHAVVEALRGAWGARAVTLVEYSTGHSEASAEVIILAAAGDAEALPELRPGATGRSDNLVSALHKRPGAGALGLVVAHPEGNEMPSQRWLDGVLRLVARLRSAPAESVEEAEPGPAETVAPGDLVFPEGIVAGRSPSMLELYQQMASVAATDLPVLLLGETGVGKEHLAESLHLSSSRRSRPFIAVNCAAIPAEQLEAEMFGIGKGVATGVDARPGSFRRAEGGTLFLDEIGELPLPLQAKLLRALQDGQVHPVGLAAKSVDVRIVAATNAQLEDQVAAGLFRSDLFFRLAGWELQVPPLRQRRDDLASLMAYFLGQASRQTGKRIRGLSAKALRLLVDYPWPGNVRELEHEMRRLALRSLPHQAIDSTLLSKRILRAQLSPDLEVDLGKSSLSLDQRLDKFHEIWIRQALEAVAGNQTRAAEKLGISRSGLIKRMKRLEIDAKDHAPGS